jgi:hypothetical protein
MMPIFCPRCGEKFVRRIPRLQIAKCKTCAFEGHITLFLTKPQQSKPKPEKYRGIPAGPITIPQYRYGSSRLG